MKTGIIIRELWQVIIGESGVNDIEGFRKTICESII